MPVDLKDKIIAVDFDGTVSSYKEWRGIGVFGQPIQGVQWALGQLKSMGAIITIYTCRRETQLIKDYLDRYNIPYDYVNYSPRNLKLKLSPKKIGADIYIDDKGVTFDGEWHETFRRVINFKRWEKRP